MLRASMLLQEKVVMAGETFQTLELTRLRKAIDRIHEQVAGRDGRVEITREGCDDVCVLISRTELESLERAMEILAATEEYQGMCDHISEVAAACDAPV
jgi:hypothetical protein